MRVPESDIWQILLVDDDEDDFLLTSEMLKHAQGRRMVLDWASTYSEALEMLRAHNYDAVLVDYDLGPEQGIDLISQHTQQGSSVPFILYTGRGSYQIDVEAMHAGATLYLTKSEVNPLLLERFIRYAIERKRAEAELKAQQATLQGILDATKESIWLFGLDGVILMGNETALRRLGRPAEEVIGRYFGELVPPELVQPRYERIQQVAESRQPVEFIDQRGSIVFHHSFYPVFDNSGKVTSVAAFSRDITQQKQAEEALMAYHIQTTEILESISDAFYSLDEQGRFTYVNQKAGSLWNKDPGELLGKNIWEVFPQGRQSDSYEKIEGALKDRQPSQYESYSAFLDQWVEIHIYPNRHGISVYFQDVTERKKREQQAL